MSAQLKDGRRHTNGQTDTEQRTDGPTEGNIARLQNHKFGGNFYTIRNIIGNKQAGTKMVSRNCKDGRENLGKA